MLFLSCGICFSMDILANVLIVMWHCLPTKNFRKLSATIEDMKTPAQSAWFSYIGGFRAGTQLDRGAGEEDVSDGKGTSHGTWT